jgi:hypothetical protein
MQEIIAYREANEPARQQLVRLIGKLTSEVQARPWDAALDAELEQLTDQTQALADALPGPRSAWRTFTGAMTTPSTAVKLAGRVAVTAFVAPNLPLVIALGAGALALGGSARDAALAAYDTLRAVRTPEQNGVAYLHHAARR